MLEQATISFLKQLRKNNNKPWFDENRKRYEAAKLDMERLVQSVIDAHAKNDPTIADLKAKACMFRINRDVRFSKDKSPYKTNFGASINAGGKKSMRAGYYLHIEPGGQSFAGGGIYMPMPPDLKKVRQEIDYNLEEFKSIVEGRKFKSVFGKLMDSEDMKLSRVPQGFEKDSPAAGYLMYKSYVAGRSFTDAEISDKTLLKKIIESFSTLQPMLTFINRSFD
jgi:uncharacterized protein (TIGR02453 family)